MSTPTQQPFFESEPQNVGAQDNMHHSKGSYRPAIIILTMIAFLSVASCILGRLCSRQCNDHVSSDLEKGLDMAKADTTMSKNKAAASSKIKSKMTASPKCELHGNKNFGKKLLRTKTTASVKSKKQELNRCELHGVYLSKNNNRFDLSGADGE